MMATTTVRSPSPAAMSDPATTAAERPGTSSRNGSSSRPRASRPPPASRGVRKSSSNESLGEMQVFPRSSGGGSGSSDPLNASISSSGTLRSNRERVANFAAQMNSSNGSLKSEDSRDSLGGASRSVKGGTTDRRSERRSDRRERGRASRSHTERRPRSHSPDITAADDEDATIVSTATSTSKPSSSKTTHSHHRRDRHGRQAGSRRHSSRSRSKSRGPHRSRSLNARKHLARHTPSRTHSVESKSGSSRSRRGSYHKEHTTTSSKDAASAEFMELNNGSCNSLSAASPVPSRGKIPRSPRTVSPSVQHSASTPRRIQARVDQHSVGSPPLSGCSEDSKMTVSEMELLAFLSSPSAGDAVTPSHSERESRTLPIIVSDNPHSGRRERTSTRERHSSQRRERATRAASDISPTRKKSTDHVPTRTASDVSPIRKRGDAPVSSTASTSTSSTSSYLRPPRTSRGVGRSQSAAAATHTQSIEALVSPKRCLPPSGARHRGSLSLSNSPADPSRGIRRAKSTDDMGDLANFFATSSSVSRRKKTSSGTRSVASMPTRQKQRRKPSDATTSTTRGSSSTNGGDVSVDDHKPPSSRSTVTATDTYYSDDEDGDESIDESMEDLNDIADELPQRSYNSSNRSVGNSSADGNSLNFNQSAVEAALQMHMSRTETLLYDVFPKHIAEALRSGRKVEPENHDCVTIFFSDIVGFTNISSELDPLQISDMLDRLYSAFDALSHYHDVFKVETIGDAYVSAYQFEWRGPLSPWICNNMSSQFIFVFSIFFLDGCYQSHQETR